MQFQAIWSLAQSKKPSDPTRFISDRRFSHQLRQVLELKQFLFEEKVKFNPKQLGAIELGPLNNLSYRALGRLPTVEEWKMLDEKLSALASYLNEDLRRKIRIRELGVFFGTLPIIFLLLAISSTLFYMSYSRFLSQGIIFNLCFLVSITAWTVSQGGLGACAYLGTRVAVQKAQGLSDSKLFKDSADITDISVLKVRVIQGLLFAFLIGLPLSYQALDRILKSLYTEGYNVSASDFAVILLPFLLGFSTNLVLVILDRSILSIQTFFGLPSAKR